MLGVAVLLTVFNRREKTLACLDNCYRQIDGMKAAGEYDFTVYLVDDGSTDGTSEAVREKFPQTILIRGNGGLYWNRGMRLAWEKAAEKDYDFYLWLNDDTLMKEGALGILMETSGFLKHKAIIAGTCVNQAGDLSYGGRTRSNRLINPDPAIPEPCHMFNGNLVLVPKAVYEVLGSLEPKYQHTFGDYDYGVRAVKAGIPRVVAPGVLAECDRNPGIPEWRDSSLCLKDRFRFLTSPKGRPPREQFLFDSRLNGVFYAIGHGLSLMFKVLFPKRR